MQKYSFSLMLILLTIENIAGFHYFNKTRQATVCDDVGDDYKLSAPFMANIVQDNQRICEGAIIHKRFIATTITCCHRMDLATVRIRVGSLDDRKGHEYDVCDYIQDPYYNPVTKTNDLCLVKLSKDMKWSHKVQPAHIPNRPLEHNRGDIFSWSEYIASHVLSKHPIYVIDKKECNSKPTQYQICVADEAGNKDISDCGIEHGSPFIQDNKWLYGLASAHLTCDQFDHKLMIFTDIYAYRHFIHIVIGNTAHNDMC